MARNKPVGAVGGPLHGIVSQEQKLVPPDQRKFGETKTAGQHRRSATYAKGEVPKAPKNQ